MKLLWIILFSLFAGNSVSGIGLKAMSFKVNYVSNDTLQTWKYRKDEVINLIKQNSPDIFCIQQVLVSHINDIASQIPGIDWVGAGRDDGISKGEYAPIFYNAQRFQLKQHGIFWLSDTPDSPSPSGICTYACFEDYETRENFQIFNTHFTELLINEESAVRLIIEKINELSVKEIPVLLTGDFTSSKKDFTIRYLKRRLDYIDGSDRNDSDKFNYIFINKRFEISNYLILDTPSSVYPEIHWPVYIETL